MAKVIYDLVVRITVTYGSIVGTILALAGVVYLFIYHDATGAIGMATIGGSMVVGRSALEKFKAGDSGGSKLEVTQTPKPKKIQEEQ